MTGSDAAASADDFPVFADVPHGWLASGSCGPVRVNGFRLAVVPTTVRQYWRFLTARGLYQAPAPRLHGFPTTRGIGLRVGCSGTVVIDEQEADLPVTCVTWHGAVAYCRWLSSQTGTRCRLPAAGEWHYAAAGPAGLRWTLGDEFDRTTYAPAASGPRPVGRTPANVFGLQDMTGNVFEWCSDGLTADEVPLSSQVIKGGAYTVRNPESFENARIFTADRLSTLPYIGFRVLSCPGPRGSEQ